MKTQIVKDDKIAVVLGAEGSVGSLLVNMLNAHSAYAEVKAFVFKRRKFQLSKVKVFRAALSDIDLSTWMVNDLFICYDASFFKGRNKIPDEQFRYFPRLMKQCKESGTGQVFLLSSKNVSSDGIFHVSRSRGMIEDIVSKIDFWSTHIYKPGFIIGEEINNNQFGKTIADRIGAGVDKVTRGWLKRNKPIEADIIVDAMVDAAQKFISGVHVYPSDWLQDYGNERTKKLMKKK